MRSLGLAFVFVCGCAPAAVVAPAAAPAALVQPVAPASEPGAPPASAAPNRCARVPGPKPDPDKASARRGQLCVDHRKIERMLRRDFAKEYRKARAHNTLEVGFGCDPLITDVESIVVERGSGHGGSLTIWHLTRAKDDKTAFEVLGIAGSRSYLRAPTIDGQDAVLVARGRLASQKLDAALEVARPALTALFRELEQPTPLLGLSGYGSSGNLHHFVAIRDAGGHELSRQFTGYPSGGAQHHTIGLGRAVSQLGPLLDAYELEPERASDELREWFSLHLAEAWPRTGGEYAWWVRERLVTIAGRLKDRTAIPMVVDQLEWGLAQLEEAGEKREQLTERYLLEPLTILTRLSDWDPRVDSRGNAVGLANAARDAISECRR